MAIYILVIFLGDTKYYNEFLTDLYYIYTLILQLQFPFIILYQKVVKTCLKV